MKTFINVLYRRILYKIPLKLLLILLAVFGVLFACFSNAVDIPTSNWYNNGGNGYVFDNQMYMYRSDIIPTSTSSTEYNVVMDSDDFGFICLKGNGNVKTQISFDNSSWYQIGTTSEYCFKTLKFYLKRLNSSSSENNVSYSIFITKDSPLLTEYQYTSLQCQTEYNLIPISSVDQNYCTTNNLCPAIPIGTGNLTQLYINNILHVGAPTILMNIPDEIDWDYAYTQGGNIMNIDIVGYNVDYQAVEDQIIIQKFKPSASDLSLIVSSVIPLFIPGLCIILLLYFIFKFIKKVF